MHDGGMPWRQARDVGDRGEDLACAHLESLGWEVLDRNWRCARGELDVIARDPDGLVFCEVKARRSVRFGSPLDAIGQAKAARLRRLAWEWLTAHDKRAEPFRVDVVAVLLLPGEPARVEHLQGVA